MAETDLHPEQIQKLVSFANFKEISLLCFCKYRDNLKETYKDPIECFRSYDPRTPIDYKSQFITFLIRWGNLGRRRTGLEHLFDELTREGILGEFVEFREKILWETPYEERKVLDFYNKIANYPEGGPTVVPKILHLFCPKYFLPIDQFIRKAFKINNKPNGYSKYLRFVYDLLQTNDVVKEAAIELGAEFETSALFTIDKYCWVITNNKITVLKEFEDPRNKVQYRDAIQNASLREFLLNINVNRINWWIR